MAKIIEGSIVKEYIVPSEYPFLIHGTPIFNLEGVLTQGIKAGPTGYSEDLEDEGLYNSVCAIAPEKIKNRSETEISGYLFGNSAYSASEGTRKDIIITFEMPIGESVFLWDEPSWCHYNECRIPRDIKPEQIKAIQLPENYFSRGENTSLERSFMMYFINGVGGFNESAEFNRRFPEVKGLVFESLRKFLSQYNLTKKHIDRLEEIEVSGEDIHEKAYELYCKVSRGYKYPNHDEKKIEKHYAEIHDIAKGATIRQINRDYSKIVGDISEIFREVLKKDLGLDIDFTQSDGLDIYLDNFTMRHHIKTGDAKIFCRRYIGDYLERE